MVLALFSVFQVFVVFSIPSILCLAQDFFSNIGEAASVSRELMAGYKNLRTNIARRFNWHDLGLGLNDLKFDAGAGAFCLTNEEDDDEAPVFVSEAELASGSGL